MRQVSLISTTVLVLLGFALWIPFPAAFAALDLSHLVAAEPTAYLLLLGVELLRDNLAIRVIGTIVCLWSALYLQSRTVTPHR